ncbi:spore germination protein [Paenibacillus sp. 7541]|uniref:Spore germination protein n=3 Tax=Paenibacillus TaxID=44249 RepID=A0A268EW76_9BACL|nr:MULTISPECIES: spore germination protein [Paenibacillus]PAD77378.1 spore germination protein [Paenibacillus campinasensis]PAK50280.1 spore germination protein [Paenibacillus sp. 7541]
MFYIPKWSVFVQSTLVILIPILFVWVSRRLRDSIRSVFSLHLDKSKNVKRESSLSEISGTGQYDQDLQMLQESMAHNADVHFREFTIRGTSCRAVVVYVEGLANSNLIDSHLIAPLMREGVPEADREDFEQSSESIQAYLESHLLTVSHLRWGEKLQPFVQGVLNGSSGLLIEGMKGFFLVGMAKGKSRNVEDPISEALLRGPRIGFTERIGENMGLLRMHGKDEGMVMKKYEVGTRVKKELVLIYMKDIANQELINEIDSRIRRMAIDDPMDSGYIEQLIEDSTLSPFQQLQNTERPDRVIGAILEGRAAILLDGTPFALIMPVTFSMLLQSPEDYYERWISGSFVRLLRFSAAFLALWAPSLYISFISYHSGMIPTSLALSIVESRQGLPFPSIIEAFIMELSIEILREAGIRLPKPIGPAMGIVGGLIIGDAAVNAGIVSPFLIIVVAVTAISSFTIPVYSAGITLRILRFTAMIFAGIFGLYGVIMFFLLICSHLVKLRSFGIPYLSPLVPYRFRDWKDYVIRSPLKILKQRPAMLNPRDKDRRTN